ncbi:protein LURP-one-related 7 [Euphorbia lathyris]|uniref:protein LURP-one-related 7 n=1 Tax=Euphorbia lathyris TaxID=212925 RepID=UPI0033141B6B
MDASSLCDPTSNQIPIDLFVSKKHPGLSRGDLGFADSCGNLLFRVKIISSRHSSSRKWAVINQLGTTLISIHRRPNGNWHCYKGDSEGEKELVFKVQRTVNEFCRTELEVSFVKESSGEFTSDLKVKGCVFQRSFTIYAENSVIAQGSLMYKLHQILVRRSAFRLTIFPGSLDHSLVVALVVIFLDG